MNIGALTDDLKFEKVVQHTISYAMFIASNERCDQAVVSRALVEAARRVSAVAQAGKPARDLFTGEPL
jgi:hypothetical protein